MTALSIVLPDFLANESKKVAQRLGISRTQFIRLAISHELEALNSQFEQEAMVNSILAMKKCREYLTESEAITENLNSILPPEGGDIMVEEILTRGGVYLARLNPAKEHEVGKIRPVVILTSQIILNVTPPTIFICPLSSQSRPEFSSLHVQLPPRDSLLALSYALAEHCRSISIKRIAYPRLANVSETELSLILHRLQKLIGL